MASDTIYAWSQTAASNASADASINWAEFQTPSSVNDSARAMMARVATLISDMAPNRTSTGTGNAYAVDSDAAGSSHRNGEQITFIPHATNTGACTLNVDGRGAKAWRPAPSVDFSSGNIIAGVPVTAYYRSLTDEWVSPGTGYYVTSAAAGVALQSITARLPQIGDMVISFSPTPGSGRIRLTEATQTVLKSAYPELNSYLSGLSYPWGSTATTFSLPPAAGYFLRFAGTSSGIDTSGARSAGSTQTDQNKAHTHTVSTTVTGTTNTTGAHTHTAANVFTNVASIVSSGGGTIGSFQTVTTSSSGDHSHTVTGTGTGTAASDGGDEVRVKNVAFHIDIVASTALAGAQIAVFGFPYQWDTTTTAGDPGTGRVRGNNATLTSITELYISQTDGWGVDLGTLMSAWSTSTIVHLSKVGAQANRIAATITATPTDSGAYYTVPVSVQVGAGTLSNSDQLALEYARDGTDGVTVPDISGLTEDTAPDLDADYTITYDTSATGHKKVKPAKFTRNTTRGDITVRGASLDQRLAIGTSGYALMSDGTDPSWTGFVQSGTGATTRTWQAKARERVTVTDFGAVGDGVTDDSTAFTRALAAGQTVIVPYKSSGYNLGATTFTVANGQRIIGENFVKLTSTTTGALFAVSAWSGPFIPYTEIKGFTIDMTSAGSSSTAIRHKTGSGNVYRVIVEDCIFQGVVEAIGDESHASNYVVDCQYKNITCWFTRGRQLYLRRSRGFMLVRDFLVDHTQNSTAVTWRGVQLEDFIGLELERVDVVGPIIPTPTYQANCEGIYIHGTTGKSSVSLRRCSCDNTMASAMLLDTINELFLDDVRGYQCLGNQITISNCNRVYGSNVLTHGAVGVTGAGAGASGLIIDTCTDVKLSNVHTESCTAHGLSIATSTDVQISNFTSKSNTSYGVIETGTSDRNIISNGYISGNGANWSFVGANSCFIPNTSLPLITKPELFNGFGMPINMGITASVNGNILTVSVTGADGNTPSVVNPVYIPFRNVTAATGTPTWLTVTSALTMTTNATGATLGSANSVPFRLWLVCFNNGGTPVLALFQSVTGGATPTALAALDEAGIASSTAISGSATAAGTFYTPNGTTVTSKAYRILGYLDYGSGLATAGSYASVPTKIQLFGAGVKKPGDVVKSASASTTTVTTTTSTTFTSTNLAVSITPTSAANLARVRAIATIYAQTSGAPGWGQIFNNGGTGIGPIAGAYNSAGQTVTSASCEALDAPGSTSSYTYTWKIKDQTGGGTQSSPATTSYPAFIFVDEVMA